MPFNQALKPFINVYWQMTANHGQTGINLNLGAHIMLPVKIKTLIIAFICIICKMEGVISKK